MDESDFREQAREAAESKQPKVFLTSHAKQQMLKREITVTQIKRVIKNGRIEEGPYQDPCGDWKANFRAVDAGQDICVVVAIKIPEQGNPVFVVTVIDKFK